MVDKIISNKGRNQKNGRFLNGNKVAQGVSHVTGRTLALRTLDDMLSSAANQKRLRLDLQRELHDRPIWFFRNIIMPLIPKEQLLQVTGSLNTDMGVAILEALRSENADKPR